MKGYKVFGSDWKCLGFQYEVGKTYRHDGEIGLCDAGFHFCESLADCFNYYSFDPQNKVAEIYASGKIKKGNDKSVTETLKIVKELGWHEVLILVNSGKHNTGYRNSGDSNSGYRNSGDSNSGDSNSGDSNSGHRNSGVWNSGVWNSGHRNSGDWNSGYRNSGDSNSGDSNSGDSNSGHWNKTNNETGFFNSEQSEYINVFNKKCLRSEWEDASKPSFIYFDLTIWIDFDNMSDNEKKNYPNTETCGGGYLKSLEYKEAWRLAYGKATSEDIELLKALPNFDAKVFEEISGIKID